MIITKKMALKVAAMEAQMGASIVTYTDLSGPDKGKRQLGGQCSCCSAGPDWEPDWRGDPWLVYRAGICDSDGIYYSMLCEGCLGEIMSENMKRKRTVRDEQAGVVSDMLGDDVDGAQAMMEDM